MLLSSCSRISRAARVLLTRSLLDTTPRPSPNGTTVDLNSTCRSWLGLKSRSTSSSCPAKISVSEGDHPEPGSSKLADLLAPSSESHDHSQEVANKWRHIALDNQLLEFESDPDALNAERPCLVDHADHQGDIELWACLLTFRYRRYGPAGAATIFKALNYRRALHNVKGTIAAHFWRALLRGVCEDETCLPDAMDYAIWLVKHYDVQWPDFYDTVIRHFLSTGQNQKAVMWHLRLSPFLGPSLSGFTELLREFITVLDREIQRTLQRMYLTSVHRQLYDGIVPYLYSRGATNLLINWRPLLVACGDLPLSQAAGPYLRFLHAYFPDRVLSKQEAAIAGLTLAVREGLDLLNDDLDKGRIRRLMNRIHGKALGIEEMSYNDSLGARWFASTWVSLDIATEVIRALGVREIGPLSLQSISLRERTAERVQHRVTMLEEAGIYTGSSAYARAVKHFARAGDDHSLSLLLGLDFHPDVFDDVDAISNILAAYAHTGDWDKYHLVHAVKLSLSIDAVTRTSNWLIVHSLTTGNHAFCLRVLDDMAAREIPLLPETSNAISKHIFTRVSPHAAPHELGGDFNLDFYFGLCRRMTRMPYPLTSLVVQCVLYRLARECRLGDFETLSLEIIQRYRNLQHGSRPFINIHSFDMPPGLQQDCSRQHFGLIPRDLSLRNALHPIQLIFHPVLIKSLIRWGFHYSLVYLPHTSPARSAARPLAAFHFARGVRFAAILGAHGVNVSTSAVRKIVLVRLAELIGTTWQTKYRLLAAKHRMRAWTLAEAKQLCDEAWGHELLPALDELEKVVAERGEEKMDEWAEYVLSRRTGRYPGRGRREGERWP